MNNSVKGSTVVNASAAKIWDVLTNADKIVQYLGSQISTDWAPGSLITWEGEMHGAKFQNKGQVLEAVEN